MNQTPEFAFVGDRLEVRDAPSLKRLDRKYWSASGMKSIENCPASWAADKLLPDEPDPFGAKEIGTSSHLVLELLYQLPQPERTMERAMSILRELATSHPDEIDFPEGPAEMMRWQGAVAEKVNGDFALEDPTTVQVVQTEKKLLNTIGGVPFIGFIDRLDRLPNGQLSCVDYKSGKVKMPGRYGDEHGDQIRLYTASLRADGMAVDQGRLLYIGSGNGGPKARTVTVTDAEVNRVIGGLAESYSTMKTSAKEGSYATRESPLCGWCPLATVCPTAAAAGRTPKVPRAMLGTTLGVRVQTSTEGFTPAPATVDTSSTDSPVRKKRPMYKYIASHGTETVTGRPGDEKAWVHLLPDGSLNANGYGAMGYAGMAGLAAETLVQDRNAKALKAARIQTLEDALAKGGSFDERDFESKYLEIQTATAPKVKEIAALTKMLQFIVEKVWEKVAIAPGQTADAAAPAYRAESGLSTRIRGVQRAALSMTPLPEVGADAAQWEAWVNKMIGRTVVLMDNTMDLFVNGPGNQPWAEMTD